MCTKCVSCFFFFFKQKTAYEIPKRDWSSDVCSSDLGMVWTVTDLQRLRSFTWEAVSPGVTTIKIGRASCRERVKISVVAGSLKKKNVADLMAGPAALTLMHWCSTGTQRQSES